MALRWASRLQEDVGMITRRYNLNAEHHIGPLPSCEHANRIITELVLRLLRGGKWISIGRTHC